MLVPAKSHMNHEVNPPDVLGTVIAVENILLKWDPDAVHASAMPPTPELAYLPVRILCLLMREATIEDVTECLSDPCMAGSGHVETRPDHRTCAEELIIWWNRRLPRALDWPGYRERGEKDD